jgi:hypothetical protein
VSLRFNKFMDNLDGIIGHVGLVIAVAEKLSSDLAATSEESTVSLTTSAESPDLGGRGLIIVLSISRN